LTGHHLNQEVIFPLTKFLLLGVSSVTIVFTEISTIFFAKIEILLIKNIEMLSKPFMLGEKLVKNSSNLTMRHQKLARLKT
jgi:hypothetical protein